MLDHWPSTTKVCWWTIKSHLCSCVSSAEGFRRLFVFSVHFVRISVRLLEACGNWPNVAVPLEIVRSVTSIEATESEVVRSSGRQTDVLEVTSSCSVVQKTRGPLAKVSLDIHSNANGGVGFTPFKTHGSISQHWREWMSCKDVDNEAFPVEAESCHVASFKNLPAKDKQIIEAAELNLEWNLNRLNCFWLKRK